MGNYAQTTLGALCVLTKGAYPTEKTPPGPYPLIVTAESPRTSDSFQFDGEAVCIPIISSTGHGHASLKRIHFAQGRFAVANLLVAAQPRRGAPVDTRWLWLYLNHYKDSLIVPLMWGTANVSLKPAQLGDIGIDLPPLAEQGRIVDLIGAVDSTTEAAVVLADQAWSATRAFLASSFPAPGSGDIPVASLATVNIGGVWGSEPGTDEADVTVLRSTEFSADGVARSRTAATRSVPERVLQSRRLEEGDILLEKSGGTPSRPVGRVVTFMGDVRGPAVPSNFVQLLRPDPGRVHPDFLFWLLWSWHARGLPTDYQSATTNIHNLRTKEYLSLTIDVPDAPVQQRLANAAGGLASLARSADDVGERLVRVRSALLASLLSGGQSIPASYDRFLHPAA